MTIKLTDTTNTIDRLLEVIGEADSPSEAIEAILGTENHGDALAALVAWAYPIHHRQTRHETRRAVRGGDRATAAGSHLRRNQRALDVHQERVDAMEADLKKRFAKHSEMSRRILAQREGLNGVGGRPKPLHSLTLAEVRDAANHRTRVAMGAVAAAKRMTALADAMENFGAETVIDLPTEVIEEAWANG